MPMNQQDARAITYLTMRLRDDTDGCRKWDEAGTYAKVAELIGQSLAMSLERVLCHATDPEAKTPGAILRPFTPPKPSERPKGLTPPKRHEACDLCGGFKGACPCSRVESFGDDVPVTPEARAEAAALRERIHVRREALAKNTEETA